MKLFQLLIALCVLVLGVPSPIKRQHTRHNFHLLITVNVPLLSSECKGVRPDL